KYTERPGIVSLECGFHGRTLMAMSLTSKVKPYKFGFGPFAPEVYKVHSPYCYRCLFNATYPGCGLHCLEYVQRFLAAEAAAEKIAAVVVEVVQGEGGFIVCPKDFLLGLKELCKQYGIVYIVDEIQTGFGRTGRMFASEHYGLEPDLMALAKSIAAGLPLSAVVGRAEIMDAPAPGEVGGTYGGNPVSCAAALAAIDKVSADDLPARARHIGQVMLERLTALKEKYPLVGDVRGLGAMVGMELVRDRKTKEPATAQTSEIISRCAAKGLITLKAGIYDNVVRFLVPLVVTDEQLEWGLAVLESVVSEVA
ncbi:MAG: aminotransferase class III-fold pyridoxal phosphate-dependent enzyme, partial [Clostridia bacterium]|nr:aminotransferase class III-fold pyridoxal phosphate-dependent enzyme [Clostridia bacterium]